MDLLDDPKFRPENWDSMSFEERYAWLAESGRLSSVTISRYAHESATKPEYLECVQEYLTIAQIRERHGPGRYDLRANVVGGGSGARDADFRIGGNRSPSSPAAYHGSPTPINIGQPEAHHPRHPSTERPSSSAGHPSDDSSLVKMLLEEIREMRRETPVNASASLTSEDLERQLREERARNEREREEDRRRFEEDRRAAAEKARLEADIEALKREADRSRNEPRKALENDPGLITTLIGKITEMSSKPAIAAEASSKMQDPFELVNRLHEMAGKLVPSGASTVGAIVGGLADVAKPALEAVGGMMAQNQTLLLEIKKMETQAAIEDRRDKRAYDAAIQEIAMARAGVAAPEPLPAHAAEPVADSREAELDDDEESDVGNVVRTFLECLINTGSKNAERPEAEQDSMPQVVDSALAEALSKHRHPEVLDALNDGLEIWLYSDINTEDDEIAFMNWLQSCLGMFMSMKVAAIKSNPQVRGAALTAFREVQRLFIGFRNAEREIVERWNAVFGFAGLAPLGAE